MPDPLVASTRAMSIRAPRQRRLAMAGADGLAAGGLVQLRPHRQRPDPSADRIMAELQELRPGDFVPEGPGAGRTVTTVEPGRLQLLTAHGPMRGVSRVLRRDSSWLFPLDDLGAGHCRLIERARPSSLTTTRSPGS